MQNPAVNGPVPESPHVITASPVQGNVPQHDWDATSDATMNGWKSLEANAGTVDFSGTVTEGFPDGPGRWKQT